MLLNKFLDRNLKIIKDLRILKQINGIIYKIYLMYMIEYIHSKIIKELVKLFNNKI